MESRALSATVFRRLQAGVEVAAQRLEAREQLGGGLDAPRLGVFVERRLFHLRDGGFLNRRDLRGDRRRERPVGFAARWEATTWMLPAGSTPTIGAIFGWSGTSAMENRSTA